MTVATAALAPEQEREPASGGADSLTLLEGSTFAVSSHSGDMWPSHPHGLFYRDTRIVSQWVLHVAGESLQVLDVVLAEPFHADLLVRAVPAGAQTDLLLERRRYVGDGMREDLRLRNLSRSPVHVELAIEVAADFADVFAVKEGRAGASPDVETSVEADALVLQLVGGARGVRIAAIGASAEPGRLRFAVDVAAAQDWTTSVVVSPLVDGRVVPVPFSLDRSVEESAPAERLRSWHSGVPRIESADPQLTRTVCRSLEDLGSLRIADPAHPSEEVVAAGAPWFMTLFGRDSLLASYMAVSLDPHLALGTLRALARAQGTTVDPRTEEEPGRILHETRLGLDFPLAAGGGSTYYGTADATPLFVVVLGELSRWGITHSDLIALLPAADRALAWVADFGDRDGDGFVEYGRTTSTGLLNQGWKDSFDGVNSADGRIPHGPIALCEVQGYVYAALVARAHLADAIGEPGGGAPWERRAQVLKDSFNERFWLPEQGWVAVGLDGAKRPIDALASTMGHCLWSGIVDDDKAERVVEHLLSPAMFTGWGIRTLASGMSAYNPMSYHNGSVWPHDNALAITGMTRYGFTDEAQRVAEGLLDAAAAFDGRLPELFCGFARDEYAVPVPYPTSCSPQAWAAAAPIQVVRALLGLNPDTAHRLVEFDPTWPRRYGPLSVHDLLVAGSRVTAHVDADGARLVGLPEDTSVRKSRQPIR